MTPAAQPSGSQSIPSQLSPKGIDEYPPLPERVEVHIPPRIDERCFTWCAQRSDARAFQSEPECRTLCWRKIHGYERKPPHQKSEKMKEAFHAEMKRLTDLKVVVGLDKLEHWRKAVKARDEENTAIELDIQKRVGMSSEAAGRNYKALPQLSEHHQDLIKRMKLVVAHSLPSYRRVESDLLSPFPPPYTDRWSLLQGHYIYYSRGPRRPTEHMRSLRHLGLPEKWPFTAAETMRKEGRTVSAVLDTGMLPAEKDLPRTMGLKEVGPEANRAGGQPERPWDPNYAMLISLEHVPPMVWNTVFSTIWRACTPAHSLLERWVKSVDSGQQDRNARILWERVWDLEAGPLGTLKKLGEAFERRRKERKDETKDKEREKGRGENGGSSLS